MSFFDGTWASGDQSAELRDFIIMRVMGWSWPDLQATPEYVRTYVLHFLRMQRGG